jgi:hypothetical protein
MFYLLQVKLSERHVAHHATRFALQEQQRGRHCRKVC